MTTRPGQPLAVRRAMSSALSTPIMRLARRAHQHRRHRRPARNAAITIRCRFLRRLSQNYTSLGTGQPAERKPRRYRISMIPSQSWVKKTDRQHSDALLGQHVPDRFFAAPPHHSAGSRSQRHEPSARQASSTVDVALLADGGINGIARADRERPNRPSGSSAAQPGSDRSPVLGADSLEPAASASVHRHHAGVVIAVGSPPKKGAAV